MSWLLELDRTLFHAFYDSGGPALRWIFTGITHLGTKGGIWIPIGLLLLLFGKGPNRRLGGAVALAMMYNVLLNEQLIKRLVGRARPWLTEGVPLLDTWVSPYGYSFASGHSVCAFACCWVLGARFPRWRWPLLALATLIALSRVYLGAHYPSDVTAGAVIGLVGGVAVARLLRIEPVEKTEPE
ncbi:MAG: phosphatase PAP2 family protein [bacterium]